LRLLRLSTAWFASAPAAIDGDVDHASAGIRSHVGCGHVIAGHQIVVVDPVSKIRCTPHQVGEIWVAGPSVAHGYWGKPEQTSHTFGATLSDGEGPFLRTGDLGFVRDGELFVTGRLKDVIIVAGRNHYPQDLELTAERAHPALRPGCGAAFALEGELTEQLALVFEIDNKLRDTPVADIAAAVSQRVAEFHDLELHELVLIEHGQIPKTTSGKIQRSACRQGHRNGKLPVIATWQRPSIAVAAAPAPTISADAPAAMAPAATAAALAAWRAAPTAERPQRLEAWLRAEASTILSVPQEQLSEGVSLLQLGLSSLTAVELRGQIDSAIGAPLSLAEIFRAADLAALAALVAAREAAGRGAGDGPASAPVGELVPSFAQQRLWLLSQLQPESADYNECLVRLRDRPRRLGVRSYLGRPNATCRPLLVQLFCIKLCHRNVSVATCQGATQTAPRATNSAPVPRRVSHGKDARKRDRDDRGTDVGSRGRGAHLPAAARDRVRSHRLRRPCPPSALARPLPHTPCTRASRADRDARSLMLESARSLPVGRGRARAEARRRAHAGTWAEQRGAFHAINPARARQELGSRALNNLRERAASE
jgi:aryl carrier-like protein